MPATARPTEPPIWRKKVRLLVATPSCRNGTAFWTTIVKTEKVGPMPTPAMNIQSHTVGMSVSAVSWVISAVADGHQHERAEDERLVAAGPRHDDAGHDRADDQPDQQRAALVARTSVGSKPLTNWNQRGRKMIAPKNAEADQERRDHRRRVGPVPEHAERDDRLLGPRLDQHEQRAEDGRRRMQPADRRVGPLAGLLVGQADQQRADGDGEHARAEEVEVARRVRLA